MESNVESMRKMQGFRGSSCRSAVGKENPSDQALREKNRFWTEIPARRFVVYFGVFVTSEVLVGGTLHWVFHLL